MVKIILILLISMIFISCEDSLASSTNVKKTMLIAHRGGMIVYPENSLISFEKAVKYTNYIEMDIHFSKDNIPVVIHDKTLNRLTNCKGLVSEKTWSELEVCRLKKRLDWNYSDYYLSQFKSVLSTDVLNDVVLIVEIKNHNYVGIDEFMTLIENNKNIYIQSFNLDILQYIYNNYDFENLYFISNEVPKNKINFLKGLILNSKNITRKTKEENENMEIFIYTVDKEDEFEKYLNFNIDGIITNDVRYFQKYY